MNAEMLNGIPIIGWLISAVVYMSMALPFWICWTVCGIGERFFAFLPLEWQVIGFWECFGIFTCVGIAKFVVTPKLATVTQNNKND